MDLDLVNQVNNKCKYLDSQIGQLEKTGQEYAKAYADYRVALAQELVKLKSEWYAISLASDIARGRPEIAHLKYQEIWKEAVYKANLESINATKLQIKIMEAQIEREWSHNE